MTAMKEPVCDSCQPKLTPVVEGSTILVPVCQCLGQARCNCPSNECQCWSCQRRVQHSSDHLSHQRQASYDWRDLDNEILGNIRDNPPHSKFCECRGSVNLCRDCLVWDHKTQCKILKKGSWMSMSFLLQVYANVGCALKAIIYGI
jgi:hypothetical protein